MGNSTAPPVLPDREGNIYVADWGNERVQILAPDGSFRTRLRGEAGVSKWGESYFIANQDELAERQKADLEPPLELPPTDATRYESASIEKLFWGPIAGETGRSGPPLRGELPAPHPDLREKLAQSVPSAAGRGPRMRVRIVWPIHVVSQYGA